MIWLRPCVIHPDIKMENLKQILSERVLNFVETLPQFRGGVIAGLQHIRERQRKRSTDNFTKRKLPKDTSIELRQITLVVTFEYEDFKSIQMGLKRLFPKSEKIAKFVKDLKNNEDNERALMWHNLGVIAKEKGSYYPDLEIVDDLPAFVDFVSLSYHRILPSVACIVFHFNLGNEISNIINRVQTQEYLDPVIFKRFWPVSKIHRAYSMGGVSGAHDAICKKKNAVRVNLTNWIKNSFKWNGPIMDAVSFVDAYEIKGNPTTSNELKEWQSRNGLWLQDYGISGFSSDTFISNEIIYTMGKPEDAYNSSDVIAMLQTDAESKLGDFLEDKVGSVVVVATLYSLVARYRKRVEILRAKGFKGLNSTNREILKNASNAGELKRIVTLITRLKHEATQSNFWVIDSVSEIGTLKNSLYGEEINLGEAVVKNVLYQINQVKESAEIIDAGLTNYLTVQNIYVMYKLQKWMFILTIVVTVATIVGVVSGWDNLKLILVRWFPLFMSLFNA